MTEAKGWRTEARRFFDLTFWQATVSNIVSLTVFGVGAALVAWSSGHITIRLLLTLLSTTLDLYVVGVVVFYLLHIRRSGRQKIGSNYWNTLVMAVALILILVSTLSFRVIR